VPRQTSKRRIEVGALTRDIRVSMVIIFPIVAVQRACQEFFELPSHSIPDRL
jgi:hypothetical protein